MKKSNSSNNNGNSYAKFSAMAFQLAIPIGLGVWLGGYLDEKWKMETPWMTVIFSLLGVFIGLYLVLSELSKLNNK